jgi:hypothetical protein
VTAPWALVVRTADPERLRLACETGLAAAAFDVPVMLVLAGPAAALPLDAPGCAAQLEMLREWVSAETLGPFREAGSLGPDAGDGDGAEALAPEALQARLDRCAQVLEY